MKVIISILLSVAIFFTMAWWNQKIINKGSQELLQQASKLQAAINKEDWELALKETEGIKKAWTHHKKTWLILLDHQVVDEIDLSVYNIDETVKSLEKSEALEDITEFRFHVQDAVDKERLELANIF